VSGVAKEDDAAARQVAPPPGTRGLDAVRGNGPYLRKQPREKELLMGKEPAGDGAEWGGHPGSRQSGRPGNYA